MQQITSNMTRATTDIAPTARIQPAAGRLMADGRVALLKALEQRFEAD